MGSSLMIIMLIGVRFCGPLRRALGSASARGSGAGRAEGLFALGCVADVRGSGGQTSPSAFVLTHSASWRGGQAMSRAPLGTVGRLSAG